MSPSAIGPYQFLGRLGSGAMGTVSLAWDPRLERPVAIKVLASNLTEDPKIVAYFEREARTAAQMQHECIVAIYAIDREGDDSYLVMEFVDGLDLAKLLAEAGTPPCPVALVVLRDIARALEHAHEESRRIVHRDVKPANVMVRRDGAVKLTDFGLGRRLEGDMSLTQAGDVVGTAAYMSPEQASGQPVDCSSDVFSAGIVAYQVLAGRRPFGGPDCGWEQMVALIRTRDAAPLASVAPDVPEEVARLVDSMLRKVPGDRPTMRDVVRGLDQAIAAHPAHPMSAGREKVREWAAAVMPAKRTFPRAAGATEARDPSRSAPHAAGPAEVPDRTAVMPAGADVAAPESGLRSAAVSVAARDSSKVAESAPDSRAGGPLRVALLAVTGALVVVLAVLGVLLWMRTRPKPPPLAPALASPDTTIQVTPAARPDTIAAPPPSTPDAATMFARADRLSDPHRRLAAYDEFLRAWPDHPLARQCTFRKGYTAYEAGEYSLATRTLRDVRRRWPGSEQAATAEEMLKLPELQ